MSGVLLFWSSVYLFLLVRIENIADVDPGFRFASPSQGPCIRRGQLAKYVLQLKDSLIQLSHQFRVRWWLIGICQHRFQFGDSLELSIDDFSMSLDVFGTNRNGSSAIVG